MANMFIGDRRNLIIIKRTGGKNMSIILIGLKIAINGIGFIASYISAESIYIPGILIGFGLMFASILIPEK